MNKPSDIPDVEWKDGRAGEERAAPSFQSNPYAGFNFAERLAQNINGGNKPSIQLTMSQLADWIQNPDDEIPSGVRDMLETRRIGLSQTQIDSSKPIILIIGGSAGESKVCAQIFGFKNWLHVEGYKDIQKYPGSSCYLYGTGRDRKDYPAIEGMFLQYNQHVVDLNE
jgi:hypothetical protein